MPSFQDSALFVLKGILIFQLAFVGISASAQAERVKSVQPDGTLELQDGRKLALAGIEMTEEALRVLTNLVADKDIDYEIDGSLKTAYPLVVDPSYVYVTSSILKLPFDPAQLPEIQRMMLNEMLLETGGATLKESLEFQYKDKFRELQSQARIRGEGIWSYEIFVKKKRAPVSPEDSPEEEKGSTFV